MESDFSLRVWHACFSGVCFLKIPATYQDRTGCLSDKTPGIASLKTKLGRISAELTSNYNYVWGGGLKCLKFGLFLKENTTVN